MSETLSDLKSLVEKEIRKITAKNDITPAELDNMTKSLCVLEKIKDIENRENMDAMSGGEYSGRMLPHMACGHNDRTFYDGRSVADDLRSYGPEMSHMRGRDPSTGRYMSRDAERRPRSDTGYSGHSIKDRMIAKLEQMYDEAKTDHERQIVDEWISRLEHQT